MHQDAPLALGLQHNANRLTKFKELTQFLTDDLDPMASEIIECCLKDGTLEGYLAITPMRVR